jgi:opacity protein-like surface antigen
MTTKTNFYRGLLASVALSALSLTANAEGGLTADWKPYVGAGAGYSVVDVKNNSTQTNAGAGPTASSSGTAKGALESLFVGAQKQINSMALGAELYGYLSQQKSKIKSGEFTVVGAPASSSAQTMERQYGYGVKLKAGYFVNPTALAYVHAGLESARFKYAGVVNIGGGTNNFKKSKSLMGMPLGVGLEVDFSSAWKTRLEYTYTKYKTWKTGNLASIAQDVVQSKLSPRQHTVVLGFSYQI